MFGILFLLFTVVPAMELYLLFQLGGAIGGVNTILVIFVTGILGASLARSQGLNILTKIQTDMQRGLVPADQIIHGLMVFAGGLLLITPGIITDFVGLSLVFPLTRHVLIGFVKQVLQRAIENGQLHFSSFSTASNNYEQARSESHKDHIFEAEYTEKTDI